MAERRKKRGWVGCLVTAPVGCFAFGAGAVGVALALMPSTCGPRIADLAEEAFHERHAGRLSVARAHLPSFLGSQELRFELEDPGGRTVLRAEVEAPALPVDGQLTWGPLRIRVPEARIDVDADGVTGLERALAHRPDAPPDAGRMTFSYQGVRTVQVELEVERLVWSASGVPGEEALVDVRGAGALQAGDTPLLRLAGTARPAAAADAPLAFELVAEGLDRVLQLRPKLLLRVAGERVASTLVESWLGSPGLLDERFGPLLEGLELRLEAGPEEAPELQLAVGSERVRIEGRGALARLVDVPIDARSEATEPRPSDGAGATDASGGPGAPGSGG